MLTREDKYILITEQSDIIKTWWIKTNVKKNMSIHI